MELAAEAMELHLPCSFLASSKASWQLLCWCLVGRRQRWDHTHRPKVKCDLINQPNKTPNAYIGLGILKNSKIIEGPPQIFSDCLQTRDMASLNVLTVYKTSRGLLETRLLDKISVLFFKFKTFSTAPFKPLVDDSNLRFS